MALWNVLGALQSPNRLFSPKIKKYQKAFFRQKQIMSEELEFIKSKRGKPICIHNGYIYNLTSTQTGLNKYRCKHRTCRGVIFLNNDNNLIDFKDHNHQANTQEIKKLKLLSVIKQRTIDTCEIPDNIVHGSIRELQCSDEMIHHLPKLKSLKDSIQKARNKVLGYHNNIINDIPDSLKFDKEGNKFLHYDAGLIENRFIIFFQNLNSICSKMQKSY